VLIQKRGEAGAATGLAASGGRRILLVGGVLFCVAVGAYLALAALRPADFWLMNDLKIYRLAGLVAQRSGPLYQVRFLRGGLSFTYPPFAAAVFAALALAPLATLKVLITAASLLSLAGAAWLAWGAAGVRAPAARAGAALAVAAVTLWTDPVQQTLGFGQVNLILMVVVLADLCQPDKRWWKGAGTGLAAGFKLTPAIFIGYLLITRRFRAAAVAAAAFGLSVGAGFAVLPGASRRYWIDGLFLNFERPGGTSYVSNQSLDGVLSRLSGSAAAGRPAWLAAAVAAGLAGLLVAAWAHRRGQELTGIVTCAVTGLLVSPVSWDHHWVWIVPALVAVLAAAWRRSSSLGGRPPNTPRRGARAWAGAVALTGVFLAYPLTANAAAPVMPEGLIWTVPAGGNNEFHWHGAQLLAGNLYALAGIAILCAVPLAAARIFRRSAPEAPDGTDSPDQQAGSRSDR
jgi:alpha-1,2-mannosyltransferase